MRSFRPVSEHLQPLVGKKRLVVYTCIAGRYDELAPAVNEAGVDHVCFSDLDLSAPGWHLRPLPSQLKSPFMQNRFAKLHPHILFPNHESSVYLDGNIRLKAQLSAMVAHVLAQGCIALYQHPFRHCAYTEAIECAAVGHDWRWIIKRQMARYRQEGFPADTGLFEASIIIRSHLDQESIRMMRLWWDEIRTGVPRDQLSLTYSAWKSGTRIVNLGPSDPRFSHHHFQLQPDHLSPVSFSRRLKGLINRQLGQWLP